MANAAINHLGGVLENLTKQLAVAVRSIQWSYAIFWELQWGGYYNGDIKTRKTVQALELKADKIGLHGSEQLRELYNSLLEGETDQNKRPSAAFLPEDLFNTEWYYLICTLFVFDAGQGLPGKSLESGETMWLCNAQYADSKIFCRSLLAKVPEDPNLHQHVKASLLDFLKPVCSEKSSSAHHNADDDKDPICAKVNHEIVDFLDLENLYSPTKEIKFEKFNEFQGSINGDFDIGSPDVCSNGGEQNHQMDDSSMLEDAKGVASQVQSWHLMMTLVFEKRPHFFQAVPLMHAGNSFRSLKGNGRKDCLRKLENDDDDDADAV
ncbi:putative LRR receptor-like serine/threonine-protein kinase [Hibiscus syriacus]|uniref:LRR receptor-like serine/threonine-protein kinase n=1 Tax=Hibiscus syriacus TaxID=106335 RepID=A0A6A3BXI7_HIBSY|nr:putative LRR receptor-like serine/threonine-protein kinase [Hibiscus syriacus]